MEQTASWTGAGQGTTELECCQYTSHLAGSFHSRKISQNVWISLISHFPFFTPLIFPLPVFHSECNGALCRGYPEHNLILNCIHSNIGWNKNSVDVKSLTSGSSRYKNLPALETQAASYKVFLSKHGIIFWFTCGSLFSHSKRFSLQF